MVEDSVKKIHELVCDFDIAMLVTSSTTGTLHSRPMAVADCTERGALFFLTHLSSDKIKEIERSSLINVAMQGKFKFVSLSCNAQVVHDRARVEALWDETMRVWFPKGKTDPDIVLIEATPQIAEYWDSSGPNAIKFLGEAVKALATGTEMKSDKTQHAIVVNPS
jgi:general stress protein 26